MSMFDAFADLAVEATVYAPTKTYNATTGVHTTTYAATGQKLMGVQYNRTAAERYYSERFQSDVTDVFVTAYTDNINNEQRLSIDGTMYAVDLPVDIGKQNDSLVIGMKEFT